MGPQFKESQPRKLNLDEISLYEFFEAFLVDFLKILRWLFQNFCSRRGVFKIHPLPPISVTWLIRFVK